MRGTACRKTFHLDQCPTSLLSLTLLLRIRKIPAHISFFSKRGHNESRTGAEGCVDFGGIAVCRWSLSLDHVSVARACCGDDVQSLRYARNFSAVGGAQPGGASQFDFLHCVVELRSWRRNGSAGVSGTDRARRADRRGCPLHHRYNFDRLGSAHAGFGRPALGFGTTPMSGVRIRPPAALFATSSWSYGLRGCCVLHSGGCTSPVASERPRFPSP